MKESKKIIIVVSILIVIGGGLLFGNYLKNKGGNEEVNDGENDSVSSGSVNSVKSKVPFKNKAEGDAFRSWVNDVFPGYALSILLDRSGSYNNSFISKAWQKHGAYYTEQKNNPLKFVSSFTGNSKIVDGKITLPINAGVNEVIFYENGRFISSTTGKSGYISKGSYSNGGRILKITEGKNAGSTLKNDNVWANLKNLVNN